jgi:MFS family permease
MPEPPGYRDVFRGGTGPLAVGLLLLELVSAVQVYITATVLPLVSDELAGSRYYGLALSAGTVAVFVATPATAPLMHRFGARTLLGVAALLHTVGTASSAISSVMPMYALGRLVQGLGTGALVAIGYAVLAERFPARLRPQLIALLTSMWLLPSLVGPSGAALLATTLGWRPTLLVGIPPLLLAVGLVITRLGGEPEEPSRPRPVPVVAVVVMTAGAGMISFGGSRHGIAAALLLAGGLLLVPAGALRVLPPGTATGRSPQAAAVAALVLATFTFLGADGLTTLYVTEGLGRPIGWAAAPLSVAGIAWSSGTLWQPRLLRRSGGRTRPVLTLGAVLLGAGAGLLVPLLPVARAAAAAAGHATGTGARLAGDHPVTPWSALAVAVLAWAVAGAGIGLLYPTLSVGALSVPAADAAAMSSSVVLAEALGSTLGTAVGGSLVSLSATLTGSFVAGLLAASALFAANALGILGYVRRVPARLDG